MTFQNPPKEAIKELLLASKSIAVIGLSNRAERTSYAVSREMQKNGYRIIPVNPTISESLGEKAYAALSDVPEQVDIVNVFRRSEFVADMIREAVRIKPKAIWLQLGVIDEKAARWAKEQGIMVVMDRCIKVEHALLIPPKG
jgi:predicted CoA-binding protein